MNAQTPSTLFPQGQASAEAVKRAASDLKDGAAEAARSVSAAAAEDALRIGEMARDWWQHQTRHARDAAAAVRHESELVRDRTRAYVRDAPVKSVLIAMAVGALIGSLTMLRSSSRRRSDDY